MVVGGAVRYGRSDAVTVNVTVVVLAVAPDVPEELVEALVADDVSNTFSSWGIRPRRVMNVATSSLVYVVPGEAHIGGGRRGRRP